MKQINKTIRRLSLPFCILAIACLVCSFGLAAASSVQTEDSKTLTTSSASDDTTVGESTFYEDVALKPDWVLKGDHANEATGEQWMVVSSEPLLKQREAIEDLEMQLVKTVKQWIDDRCSPGAGDTIDIDLKLIQNRLLQIQPDCDHKGMHPHLLRWKIPTDNQEMLGDDEYGDAYQCFAQLKFDREFESWAREQWSEKLVASRTLQVALISLGTLMGLGLLFGYCKADHKTRGFYSGRLQTIGIAILVAVGGLIWWLATQFAWL